MKFIQIHQYYTIALILSFLWFILQKHSKFLFENWHYTWIFYYLWHPPSPSPNYRKNIMKKMKLTVCSVECHTIFFVQIHSQNWALIIQKPSTLTNKAGWWGSHKFHFLYKCFHKRVKCAIRLIIQVTVILMTVVWPVCKQISITKANVNCAIQMLVQRCFSVTHLSNHTVKCRMNALTSKLWFFFFFFFFLGGGGGAELHDLLLTTSADTCTRAFSHRNSQMK